MKAHSIEKIGVCAVEVRFNVFDLFEIRNLTQRVESHLRTLEMVDSDGTIRANEPLYSDLGMVANMFNHILAKIPELNKEPSCFMEFCPEEPITKNIIKKEQTI